MLFVPSIWVLGAFIVDPAGEDTASQVVFFGTIVITIVCLPFIAWILISAINPEFLNLPGSNRLAIIAAVLFFALAGYFVGARNDIFVNCDDFKVSGNDLPSNCLPTEATPNPGG